MIELTHLAMKKSLEVPQKRFGKWGSGETFEQRKEKGLLSVRDELR